jgi:bifunctional non-homologous end joining protein LigD
MPAKTTTLNIEGRRIELSNSEKPLYPRDGYSKRDTVEYFRSVASAMVPHLRNKPLALRRFPDGIDSGGFFQQKASEHFPDWVRVEPVPQVSSGEPIQHVVCDDAATLGYLATQACLEFHIFLSTMEDLDRPVVAVVDLDPPDGIKLDDLRSLTEGICQRFRGTGLAPYVQATGGRGFHVVAPLTAQATFDEVRAAIRDLADTAAREDPDWLTTEQRKDQRGNRVFLDTNRNAYAQTMIAPYSLRARQGAPAATPLRLGELSKAIPNGFGLTTMRHRLDTTGDPWADMERDARPLPRAPRA